MKKLTALLVMLFLVKAVMTQSLPGDSSKTLQEIKVTGRKAPMQMSPGKITIKVGSTITNAGTTILEMLERLPGVTVDKSGMISLKGKPEVLVMIDDKLTYLGAAELSNLLASMNSQQVEQIELMPNPPAKFDASGNAGIINIKTIRSREEGLNGTILLSSGIGRYLKNNYSLSLNYKSKRIYTFMNYSLTANKGFTDIYALRNYYKSGMLSSVLDQPTCLTEKNFGNSIRTGIDYNITDKTIAGISFTGLTNRRDGESEARATWLSGTGTFDSAIGTSSSSLFKFRTGGINLNLRHTFSKNQQLAIDVDGLKYKIGNEQSFTSQVLAAGGTIDSSRGHLPSTINIVTGKADYTMRFGENKLESGFKISNIQTDNVAAYELMEGMQWKEDLDKSNHFYYKENIYAAYSNLEYKYKSIYLSAGLRYEQTRYQAIQTSNLQNKDSSFSRNYYSLFPSASLTWQTDSSSSFT
ncbi:MAG: outer membrane beta-barrel protein, partial [Chitinophagaceae bacterium]|nr:outer membrane beta-barrel protein [Chitinophagaceae bacterium]